MALTAEEAANALALKDIIEAADDVDSLTDFETVQFSIVSKQDHEKAMKRVRRLQELRKRYNIGSTLGDVEASVFFVMQSSPGLFLSVGTDREGRAVATFNGTMYKARDSVKNVESRHHLMGFFVHLLEAMSSDVDAVRNGIVFVGMCEGLGWENFSFEAEKRVSEIYQDSFPVRMKAMYLLDPPFIMDAMMNIVKVHTCSLRSLTLARPTGTPIITQ